MLKFIQAVWYLRFRRLWNYAAENPGHVVPGVIILAALFILNASGVSPGADTEILRRYEGLIHISLFVSFGMWMVYGLVTGLRHGTVGGLQRLALYPVTGPGLFLAHRVTAFLDPWFLLGLSALPALFIFFGMTASVSIFLTGAFGSVCLLSVCLSLVNIGEAWAHRIMARYLARFVLVAAAGCLAMIPVFADMSMLGRLDQAYYLPVLRLLPTGVLLSAAFELQTGQVAAALQTLIPLAIYAAGFGMLEWHVIRRAMSAGPADQPTGPTNAVRRFDMIVSGLLPESYRRLSPFIAKDIVSFIRFPRIWIMPFVMVGIVFINVRNLGLDVFETGMMISGYGVIMIAVMIVNRFGLDRKGGVQYLLGPLTDRDIMMSKRISVGVLIFGQLALTICCLKVYLPSNFPPVEFYTLLIFNLYLTTVVMGCGGVTSVLFPRMMSISKGFNSKGVPATSFVLLALFIFVSAVPAVTINSVIPDEMMKLLGYAVLWLLGLIVNHVLFVRSVRLLRRKRAFIFNAVNVGEDVS